MRATDFDDVLKRLCLGGKSIMERLQAGQQHLMHFFSSSNVHGGGKRVVGALKRVHSHILWNWTAIKSHIGYMYKDINQQEKKYADAGCCVCVRDAFLSTHLTLVDVVVGMHRFFAAQFAPEDFDGPVADHLVDVHVGLCS